jgi:nanoRNase/pAp phosphatase (c-di-AMP/oligoRNAs hydrolase)
MFQILELINELKAEKRVFIQTHNFPDHDAVASAYGLSKILMHFGIKVEIIYKGEIQRDSLLNMIENLNIDIRRYEVYDIKAEDKIIVVDGCKGNSNVEELIGDEIAVIDHHEVGIPENVKYVDIRSDYGSCSTIIYTYYRELGVSITKEVATALIIGLNMDTSNFTRGVSEKDVSAFQSLYMESNITLVNSILRNYIQTKDLSFYRDLINKIKISSGIAFCYFEEGCNQNLLGILGDFVLALKEVEFVILCAKNNGVINFSVRNERSTLSAATIIQEALKGIGFGGGHTDMAGGIIKDITRFKEEDIYKLFIKEIEKESI